MSPTTLLERARSTTRLDLSPTARPPSWPRVALATAVALLASLAADAALVAIGTALFPSTKGYIHFQLGDYSKLTVIGVVVACAAWPVVTRLSSVPRWLFWRLAVLVTLVLLLPDVWILLQGEPPKAVAVLMLMHLAIAGVTYNALVRIAPTRSVARHASGSHRAPRRIA